jgi:hypothetical protein
MASRIMVASKRAAPATRRIALDGRDEEGE